MSKNHRYIMRLDAIESDIDDYYHLTSVFEGELIQCAECKFAKIETHKGDEELVCWHHRPGYVTQPDGYCHRAVKREAVQ